MKKTLAILAIALLGFTGISKAQKYGHINFQDLIEVVPGYEAANIEMERYRNSKIEELKDLQTRLEKRYNDYIKIKPTLTESIQKSQEKEIQELQLTVQQFEQNAQKKINDKQTELMNPLLKQLQDAIKKVGKDYGFAYIFDISQGTVAYFDGGIDATPFVKKELMKNATTTKPDTTTTPKK